jgi:MFS family permease
MNRKPSILVIFLTVFIDLIGFGIVVPLVPLFSRHYGASGFIIGVIIASFSAMQFLFSPLWGKLSDRHGRRPILLISTAGAAFSYVLFALASGLENHTLALGALLVSRMFAGACGGNITVAQAYIADITPPENRSKRMGLIGMAFGLGFIFGPVISGVALKLGGATAPGWTAAALCALNFFLAYFILAESWKPESAPVPHQQRVPQKMPQPGQRPAHGRLTEPGIQRRLGHVAPSQQGIQQGQQVQVHTGQIHFTHGKHIKHAFPVCTAPD